VLVEKLGIDLNEGLLYGAALVAVTLFAPDGVMGTLQRWCRSWLQVMPRSPLLLPAVVDDEPVAVDVDLDVL
jgi:hypothetical protein